VQTACFRLKHTGSEGVKQVVYGVPTQIDAVTACGCMTVCCNLVILVISGGLTLFPMSVHL